MYFAEPLIAAHNPPALTHPEFFYGFLGVAVAWQLLFIVVARAPTKHRAAILAAVAEKFGYAGAAIALAVGGRVNDNATVAFGLIDIGWGAVFLTVYWALARPAHQR
jgi:hypothetical protein